MIQIYFLRHGQTEWNALQKFQGSIDIPLSDEGREQAECAAGYFADRPILDAIYSSPLARAYETAEILGECQGLDVQVVPEFSEISFGAWEGLTHQEIEAKWPGALRLLYSCPDKWQIPEAESFEDVRERALRGLQPILDELDAEAENDDDDDEKRILIVSHGVTIRMLLCGLLFLPTSVSWRLNLGNASISRVDHYGDEGNWLSLLNYMDHLSVFR